MSVMDNIVAKGSKCKISPYLIDQMNDCRLSAEWDGILLQPLTYFSEKPCYNRYPKFYESIAHWVDVPVENLNEIQKIIEMSYADITVLDDMEDDTATRKNRPAAHLIYGAPFTMNSVKMNMFIVLEKITHLCSSGGAQAYTKYMMDIVRGGGIEIYWRDNFICPEEADYIKIGMLKNFGFFHLQARLVQICGGNNQDFTRLTALIACFYFIHNDLSDFIVSEYSEGKSLCDDIIEGKFNFPIIHAVKVKGNKEILGILRKKTRNVALHRRCVQLLEELGSLQYTRDFLKILHEEIKQEVENFGGNPFFENEFAEMMKVIEKQDF